ncbi:MAG: response regulator transcription factor [Coriobacteriales bacterium]|jgi:DNA-binding response OmpR family regulator|nr:response regulator transcription factor [Coriobacteriales bacterium]
MKVLVIEDERQLSEVLTALLKQNLHEADAVYDGQSGEDYAMSNIYDAIILDIMLPGKNGLEVLRSLRARGNATPVLLLTAKSEVDDKISGLDIGADDYLTKPFATGELLARLRAITRRGSEFIGDLLRVGNTELDNSTHELRGENGAVRLASKEYQIMDMLMRNSRQIIPKERFFEKIWGFDTDAEYNAIEVYISFVRKSLRLSVRICESKLCVVLVTLWRCRNVKTSQNKNHLCRHWNASNRIHSRSSDFKPLHVPGFCQKDG